MSVLQQQQQQQPSRLVLQLCFAILLLLESMSPPKPSESPEANFYHILTSKNPRKKLQEAQKSHRGNAQTKNPGRRSRAEHRSDAASERSEAQAGFRHMALTARETTTTTRPNHGSSPTWQLRTNRITKDFVFWSFQAPTYFRGDILNASDWWNSQKGTDVDQWEARGRLKINFWAERRSQKFRSSDIYIIYLFIY
jgi:hypothetical protein